MLFKPEVVKRFADCGVTFLDEPTDVFRWLLYLGRDPNSLARRTSPTSKLLLVCGLTSAISARQNADRPPNEEVCIAMSWSGTMRRR
jgi:putrescine transport system substrate-binding protein